MNGKKIAVFLGGTSEERDISVTTGYNIARGLDQLGYAVEAFDVAHGAKKFDFHCTVDKIKIKSVPPDIQSLLQLNYLAMEAVEYVRKNRFDLVFLALHGGYGENGQIQALLELADIPFTGSGSVASSVAMNKEFTRHVAVALNIPIAQGCLIRSPEEFSLEKLPGLPCVIKPNDQGSTVGLTIVKSEKEIDEAIHQAFQFAKEVLVEKYLPGKELTVSILGDKVLPTIEIIPESGFYDYESKYQSGKTRYEVPADIPEKINEKIQEWSLRLFKELGCRHYGRVDYRFDPRTGEIGLLEINTLPGMTPTSLVPKAAKAIGISFEGLLDTIVNLALQK